MGFVKFQSLVTLLLLVLQVAVVGLAGANDSRLLYSPPHVWYCSTLLETSAHEIVSVNDYYPKASAWGLCVPRGGYFDKPSTATAVATPVLDPADATESQEANTTTAETVVIRSKKQQEGVDYSSSPYAFTLFQNNDGSQQDPDGIPTRYLKMQNYNREKAKTALEATIKWREENEINTILARPHPKFDKVKRVFPHYFCGRDDTNHVILLQRPGAIDLPSAYANELEGKDLLYHYIYVNEYLWQILEPRADETMTSIIDLSGINLSVLRKPELLNIVQTFCSTMDAHFPQRSHKTLLINAPKWFGAIYKLISPLLRETTKQKIFIYSKGKKQDEALQSLLAGCNIPADDAPIEPSEMEKELRDFVSRVYRMATANKTQRLIS